MGKGGELESMKKWVYAVGLEVVTEKFQYTAAALVGKKQFGH